MDSDLNLRERPVLYRNVGATRFVDISVDSGPGLLKRRAARGLAMADIDNDGRFKTLITSQNEPSAQLVQ